MSFLSRLTRVRSPLGAHRAVQYAFLVFFLYVGVRFYQYAMWAMGESMRYVERPAAVEAFLPISALVAAKRLLFTGQYDFVHPAGLTILLLACASALLVRKGFCGYLCPVGCVSMLLGRLGDRLGVSRRPGRLLSLALTLPKYGLLAFFAYSILWGMGLNEIEAFIRTPYNMVADTKMLLFFLHADTTLLVALGVLALGGMLVPGFWCRGFCPYGALLGLFSMCSPVAVRRDETRCTGCRKCTRVCPSRIAVHEKTRISGPECVGCAECTGVCPEPGCLVVSAGYGKNSKALPFWSIVAGTLALLALFYGMAVMNGKWNADVPPAMLRMLHENILSMQHP